MLGNAEVLVCPAVPGSKYLFGPGVTDSKSSWRLDKNAAVAERLLILEASKNE